MNAVDKRICAVCSPTFSPIGSSCSPCTTIDANCLTCDSTQAKCLTCSGSYVPNAGGTACVINGPAFCTTVNSGDNTICDLCNTNYMWQPPACNPCSVITDCLTCNHAGTCLTCTAPKIPQVGGATCVTPSPNCATYNATDNTKCSVCNTGYFKDATNQCSPCSTIVGCTTCDNAGVCSACTAP
jgi:proprotein convertase subtilisin/kexin type 5